MTTERGNEAKVVRQGETGNPNIKNSGKRCLIGPQYYDTYLFILKIVLAAACFGFTLATALEYAANPPQQMLPALGRYLATLPAIAGQAFAWLTVLFVVLEHCRVDLPVLTRKENSASSSLRTVPGAAEGMKVIEPVLSIAFFVFLIALFNAAPSLAGLYHVDEHAAATFIPLLNAPVFNAFLPYFTALFVLHALKNAFYLVTRQWTKGLGVADSILSVATLILFFLALANTGIWNESFPRYLMQGGFLDGKVDLKAIWGLLASIFMAVAAFSLVVEAITSLARSLKQTLKSTV